MNPTRSSIGGSPASSPLCRLPISQAINNALVLGLSVIAWTGNADAQPADGCDPAAGADRCGQRGNDIHEQVEDLTRIRAGAAPSDVQPDPRHAGVQSFAAAAAGEPIEIVGDERVFGIRIHEDGPVTFDNHQDYVITSLDGDAYGIDAGGSRVTIGNRALLELRAEAYGFGINAATTDHSKGDVHLRNHAGARIDVQAAHAFGMVGSGAYAYDPVVVHVINHGDVDVAGKNTAAGIRVFRGSDALAVNTGTIEVETTGGGAGTKTDGIVMQMYAGTGVVRNTGAIHVVSSASTATHGAHIDTIGSGRIDNSGVIEVDSDNATGALVDTEAGSSTLVNRDGGRIITKGSTAQGMVGHARGEGWITLRNGGEVDATAHGADNAANAIGMNASSDGRQSRALLGNDGSVNAYAVDGLATAMLASYARTTNVRNGPAGVATAIAKAEEGGDMVFASAISVRGGSGDTLVRNEGRVSAIANGGDAAAIQMSEGRNVVHNRGSVSAEASGAASGIHSNSDSWNVVSNHGSIAAKSKATEDDGTGAGTARGIDASGEATVRITTAADSQTSAEGIRAHAISVDTAKGASIASAGQVHATSHATKRLQDDHASAVAIYAAARGNISIRSEGEVSSNALNGDAIGIQVANGKANIANAGVLKASSSEAGASGVRSHGDAWNKAGNDGSIVVSAGMDSADGIARGIDASGRGIVNVGNRKEAEIEVRGNDAAALIGLGMRVSVVNNGNVAVQGKDHADGIIGLAGDSLKIINGGVLNVESEAGGDNSRFAIQAIGSLDAADPGNLTAAVDITNSGRINAHASNARGIGAWGKRVVIRNSGEITAGGDNAGANFGIVATGADIAVTNSGTITASTTSDKQEDAVGVHINATGVSSFTNSGVVNANTSQGTGTGIALLAESADPSKFTLTNTGTLNGAVITPTSGNANIVGTAGSLWTLAHQSTDLGGSHNQVHNQAGSVIQLDQSRVGMGIADNVFRNDGAIAVHGDNRIDMDQQGHGARAPMINNGVIDLSSRGAGNRLAINGDLAGRGQIVLDANKPSDALQVSGNVRDGTRQQVNLRADGIPARDAHGQTFATVDGQGGQDAFVAGEVIGQKAGNFVNLGVNVDQSSTGTGSAYQASTEVQGLNATGQLAASVGAGVQNLLSSQIGTFRQRGGAVPATDGNQRVTGFVRSFGGSADATGGLSQNFGSGGTLGMRQSNRGTEVGMALAPVNGWTMGLTMSQSDGQQNLTGGGYGMTRFDADSAGLFATWQSPKGFYVDTSAWSMRYAGRLDSAAGRQAVNGNANALNVESGYTFKLHNGLNIEPQLQYTLTRVDGMRLQGPDAQFNAQASSWQRSRAGVLAWKQYGSSNGLKWTPYASASVVHMGGDGGRYAINRDLLGTLDTLGTSTLFETGIGVNKRRFGANAGMSWTQGDRAGSDLGGQLRVSYSW